MTKKNSVTAFKKPSQPILPAEQSTDAIHEPVPTAPVKRGRPPKAVKRTHKVMLAFTPEEGKYSRERAGEASEATHIYNFLKKNGYFG